MNRSNSKCFTRSILIVVIGFALLAGACARSISNSGFPDRYSRPENPFYKGELPEIYVLGIDPAKPVAEKDITALLDSGKKVSLKKGSALLLIQSGAPIPDAEMTQALGKYFPVGVYSGVPDQNWGEQSTDIENRARFVRLAAAKGGYETIVCYWGILEASQKGLATKTVSWVPVVGWAVPDETQRMRIRLKVALVDVRSGAWSTFSPLPFDDTAVSGHYGREGSDQSQVLTLKSKAYAAAVEELVKRYAN